MSRDLFRPVNPACANIPPDVFFPIPIGAGKDSGVDERWEYPRTICRRCPSQIPCAEFALANREREGMWGALTPLERRKILDGRGRHGHVSTYKAGCRCADCTKANAGYMAGRRSNGLDLHRR